MVGGEWCVRWWAGWWAAAIAAAVTTLWCCSDAAAVADWWPLTTPPKPLCDWLPYGVCVSWLGVTWWITLWPPVAANIDDIGELPLANSVAVWCTSANPATPPPLATPTLSLLHLSFFWLSSFFRSCFRSFARRFWNHIFTYVKHNI